MTRYTRIASLIIAIALLAAALTQSSVSAAPRTPEQIMQQAKQVVVGGLHACALMDDGSVWCWGNNEVGQIGNPACDPSERLDNRPVRCPPMPVMGLPGHAKKLVITENYYYTCVIMKDDGSVWCWGGGDYDDVPLPAMPGITGVKDYQLPCALTKSGDLWCRYMQGCEVDKELRLIGQNVSEFSVRYGVTCIVTDGGDVKCAGENYYGALGNDKVDSSCSPLDVFNPFPYTTYAPSVSK